MLKTPKPFNPFFLRFLYILGYFWRRPVYQYTKRHEAVKNTFQNSLTPDLIYKKNEAILPTLASNLNGIKLLTWNIERGYDFDSILNYLKEKDADVICLQEVDWNNGRTKFLDIAKLLAEKLGMVAYFGIEFNELDTPLREAKLEGGGVCGNAILTRLKPLEVYRVELPVLHNWESPPPETRFRLLREKRTGRRFCLCATMQIYGEKVTICNAHFENVNGGVAGRKKSLEELLEKINKKGKVIIAGDMNTLHNKVTRLFNMSKENQNIPESKGKREVLYWKEELLVQNNLIDPFSASDWTFKYFVFKDKLDWILLKDIQIKDFGMDGFNSSDHKPLWVLV